MAAFMTLLVTLCASAVLEEDCMTPMKKIECARSSRRQLTLDESWSSHTLFTHLINFEQHELHELLTAQSDHEYNLRPQPHTAMECAKPQAAIKLVSQADKNVSCKTHKPVQLISSSSCSMSETPAAFDATRPTTNEMN